MTSQTNEEALEAHIQKTLTGFDPKEDHTTEGIAAEDRELYRGGHGYFSGSPDNFDATYALDTFHFWRFLEKTQEEELAKLKRHSDWQLRIKERFHRMVKKYGLLRLLRKGLNVDNANFTLLYPLPLASSSERINKQFEQNEFSITRQVRYSVDNPREEIDLVLFVNGIPLITMELKNPWTGQTAALQGQNQYRFDRDTKQPLLQFGRCVCHFTVDTDECYMTTRLAGANTFFLPFNKGFNGGKGNPPNKGGHKTAYLWEEVLTRHSLTNILQHFVRFDGKANDPLSSRTLYFPRYHQLDVVRKIKAHAAENGVGQNYLVQHSAGSGKSNSITWAAYQLIETYPNHELVKGSKGKDAPLFDSVVVVTDRRLLDKQLRENIKEFSEVKNIVAPAYSSSDLRNSLESGKRIIITTIQKFPFIVDGIADLGERNFAVIIDEAHSGQGGLAHGKMNEAMGIQEEDEELDTQEKIARAMEARKMRGNASYLAFTATPRNITLEKFGLKDSDGEFRPFHLYSMKQAIEEGFILDVLRNYTTLKSYYEIHKSIEENPLFETAKAQKKLKAFVERNETTIATKAEIMVDDFINNVVKKKRLKGKGKGMVVTQSIESAIKYFLAIRKILEDKGAPFKAMVAFSGEKELKGIKYTEESINNLPAELDRAKPTDPGYISDKLARYFNMDEYRLMVVANKYLTGFDQPKLCAMYIDKKLQGVLAVQALSRLNRSANKLGKRSEDLFVLDFFNTTEDIKAAFDKYYTATSLNSATDINVLHELKDSLDIAGVYEQEEVEEFVERYFDNRGAHELSSIIDVAAARFTHELEWDETEKADFKIKAKQFVKIYGQMASIMPFEVIDWEKLFWFLKFLIPKLTLEAKPEDELDELLESVDLSTYGLQRDKLNESIELDPAETGMDPQNPNPRGAHDGDEEKDPLQMIINSFNERHFHGWDATPEEQRVKFVQLAQQVKNHPDYQSKYAENYDEQNREIAFQKIFEEVMAKQRKNELDLYRLLSKDEAFKVAMQNTLKRVLNVSGT